MGGRGVDLLVAVLGVLALLGLCVVIGVVEGRAQRAALRRLDDDPRSQRDPPVAYPRGR